MSNGNSRSEERPSISSSSNVAKTIAANMEEMKEKKRHGANNTQRNNQSTLTTGGKQSRADLEKASMYQDILEARRASGSGMMGVNAGDTNYMFGNDDDREDE